MSSERSGPTARHDDLALARAAPEGEREARRRVSQLAHPFIAYQSGVFCKRYCNENRFHYRCTLPTPWGSAPAGAMLCEWGNASYAWMLDDLTGEQRLRRYRGEGNASLGDYLFTIANSLPFYERWKDWRFGRRVHVPEYIQALGEDAARVFLGLHAGDGPALIAQRLGRDEARIGELAQRILVELTRRGRLHLLDPPRQVSLTGYGAGHDADDDAGEAQGDIPCDDLAPETREERERLAQAWEQLDAVEQFVLEAMVIEERDAQDVLAALQRLNISIVDGMSADRVDRQQLYYFRRKTQAKLARLMGLV